MNYKNRTYEMSTLKIITSFIIGIDLHVNFETINEITFLPGILIRNGELVVDVDKLLYPGDILHEAGHLAVMPPGIRAQMNGDLNMDPVHQGGELAAIAWSYAACIHLGLDPHIVFHEHGYKGGGADMVKNFRNGQYFGVPLLSWQEMTLEKEKDSTGNEEVYPKMKSWLCMVDRYNG